MDEQNIEHEKKLVRIRKLATLSSIRKEIVRVYEEARSAGADPGKIQFYRALTFILSSAADVLRNEKLDGIEERLDRLEKKADEGETDKGKTEGMGTYGKNNETQD
ncbi:MAG TPA: hypothetical protein PK712_07690 [Rectinema sp.]|nr:hypothetical protein [Rectinema sp.]